MEVREWEAVRDEIATKVENWLDGQGHNPMPVKVSLMASGGFLAEDKDGRSIIEDALTKAVGLTAAYIYDNVVRCYPPGTNAWVEVTLPIPIREFIRGWNEGVLQ